MDPQQAKFLGEQLAALWEGEFKGTLAVLKAIPNDKRDYRPDPKSRSAWELAVHLAGSDIWFIDSIMNGAFAWDADAEKRAAAAFPTVDALAAFYEKEYPARLAALKAMPGDRFAKILDFFGMMQLPAASCIGFANNHSVHHRGQLASYLRSMGGKVPPIYGGSADFPMQG